MRSILFSLLVVCSACGVEPVVKPAPKQLPSHLIGTYARGHRVINSIAVDSDERSLRFESGNRYSVNGGAAYALEVTEHSVRFVDGPLEGKQLALGSVSPNCRIIKVDGDDLFRDGPVAQCPGMAGNALTAAQCAYVGTWSAISRSGALAELDERAVTVEVDADRFFRRVESRTKCTAGECRYDEELPQVGTWAFVQGRMMGPDLATMRFTPSAECAPMLPKPAPVLEAEVVLLMPVVNAPVSQEPQVPAAVCKADVDCGVGSCVDGRCL